jgi:CheY-like chemotaxis protein
MEYLRWRLGWPQLTRSIQCVIGKSGRSHSTFYGAGTLMKKARVLLVDDNPDNLEIVAVLLGQRYDVRSYGSAEEALGAIDMVRPNVLVLDIRMRGVDGIQCLQAIRARPGYATIPAIALTAFAREVERKAFLDAGFHAVVTKPILDERQLVTPIERLLAPSPMTAAAS